MKVGNKVILLPGKWEPSYGNPAYGSRYGHTTGKILSTNNDGLPIRVKWSNGEINSYKRNELAIYGSPSMKARLKKKRVVRPLIEISAGVFNILSGALRSFTKRYGEDARRERDDCYPYCFLLGKNRNDIFTTAIRLKANYQQHHDQCNQMINISTSVIAKVAIKIYKQHAIPCGIARVGSFNIDNKSGTRGRSLSEVGIMGGFILSMIKDEIKIERYYDKEGSKYTTYRYKIVMDGKQERIKSKKGRR